MARSRKVELFIDISSEKDFETALERNKDRLICAEIYSSFFGPCMALDRIFTLFKLDWSDGEAVLLRVLSEEIEALSRLHHQSEPFYMFIVNKRVTKTFRGVNSIKFTEVIKQQIKNFKSLNIQSLPTYGLDEATPDEMAWIKAVESEVTSEATKLAERRAARQAARKRHRAELMVPFLKSLNFVLFWPHAKHAHPELYERWDLNNIIMVGREELELTKEEALDVLYGADCPLNEAAIHALVSGKALAICFRILDDDKHFTSLVRYILYEHLESPPNKDSGPITAYEYYKSYSPTKQQIWAKRREDKKQQKEEARYKRARRISEMRRIALQAKLDAQEARKVALENQQMELLKAGKLDELKKLKEEPMVEEEEDDVIEEEPEEESSSDHEEDENEYFPPPGLEVPGIYAPPNDVAKANGLAILFPKLVSELVTPQAEFLPPHVLVMLHMDKRSKAIQALAPHTDYIIHMGIFKGTNPYNARHVAYTVKQFESMDGSYDSDDIRLCFMMSVKKDLPLLELMDLNPLHVSRDPVTGEDECAALFSVDYGDDYPALEDFED